jgi:hypothetical protein
LIAAGHLRVGMVNSRGQPLTLGLREVARLQFRVGAGHADASLRGVDPVAAASVIAALDIEPVDPRAGGYTWTAIDGSLLIGAVLSNPANPFDVDSDGTVTPADVLAGVDYLHSESVNEGLSAAPPVRACFCDVNGDAACTALDVLAVINHLNAQPPHVGEGESRRPAATWWDAGRWVESPPATASSSPAVSRESPAAPVQARASYANPGQKPSPADSVRTPSTADFGPPSVTAAALSSARLQDTSFRDLETGWPSLEGVLTDLADDIRAAWRGARAGR